MGKPIKVMIVDDSASVRKVITEIINSNPDMEVIATAGDPLLAENYLKNNWPDVFILDIEMPRKNGLTFLKEIMSRRPTPVIICSSLAEKNASVTLDALASGAVEIITKPKIGVKDFLENSIMQITDAVRSAAIANLKRIKPSPPPVLFTPKLTADVILSPRNPAKPVRVTDKIIVIGASAGGTQATEAILKVLPEDIPGIVIVQHMPEKFTFTYANRLNGVCKIKVKEAEDGEDVKNGCAFIAPGNLHLMLKVTSGKYAIQLKDGPPVSRHRPSVDVLFRSVASTSGKNALGIILTGMGDDGATGMKEMHDAGVRTIAQDKDTCMVFGMPREAIQRGGVDNILPLQKIPEAMVQF